MFRDIKVGDLVLVENGVPIAGFNGSEYYWIQKTVERVTKTQFVAGDTRFNKKWGRTIGVGFSGAGVYSKEKDQTVECRNKIAQQKAIRELDSLLFEIRAIDISRNIETTEIITATKHAKALLAVFAEDQEGQVMVMARLHLVCGNCGSGDGFSYDMTYDLGDNDMLEGHVSISCKNCGAIHDLDDNATNLIDVNEQEGKCDK